MTSDITLRPMAASDLAGCDRIMRLSFGTEFNLPDPMQFRGDSSTVRNRWLMYPDGCQVAERNHEIVGFAIASHWGSAGFLGPVCVHPDHWNQGIARRLVAASVARLDGWGCRAAGLFTFPDSPRHMRLYETFGFQSRQATHVMEREPGGIARAGGYESLAASPRPRAEVLADIAGLTGTVFPGLDLSAEVTGVIDGGFGDTLVAYEGERLAGFAVCHFGAGSEGGSKALFVKYGQVRSGTGAGRRFDALVAALAARTAELGLEKVTLGINLGREAACQTLLDMGFRVTVRGVRMHRPAVEIYDTADCYIIDDWR